jgi:Arc/MetJ-type ribon-helix-helix transcriptional regulator
MRAARFKGSPTTLTLPDNLDALLREQASLGGFESHSAFVEHLLRSKARAQEQSLDFTVIPSGKEFDHRFDRLIDEALQSGEQEEADEADFDAMESEALTSLRARRAK